MHWLGCWLICMLSLSAPLMAGETYPVPDIPVLDDGSFKKWADQIHPEPEELKWKKIPWRSDFGSAIKEASELQRPILLWSDQGNPLGLPTMAPSVNTVVARQQVWSDDEIQKLSTNFVCATAEVWTLSTGKGPASDFFHKAGGPTQGGHAHGLYLFTPDGESLGFLFISRPKEPALKLIQEGLKKWESIVAQKGYKPKPIPALAPQYSTQTWPDLAAKSGLFLQVISRDLTRGDGTPFPDPKNAYAMQSKWRWNQWFLDLTPAEAQSLLPKDGPKSNVPDALVRKLAKKYLVDNANGNNSGYRTDGFLKKAVLTTESMGLQGSLLTVRLHGEVSTEEGTEGYNPSMGSQLAIYGDHRVDVQGLYGFEGALHGKAVYDTASQKFVYFELVAVGNRKGMRSKDDNQYWPSRIGFTFSIEGQNDKSASAPPASSAAAPTAASSAIPSGSKPKIDPVPHREAIEKGLQGGEAKKDSRAMLKIFGKSEEIAFKSADASGVMVLSKGNQLPLRWKELDDEDRARLCLAAFETNPEMLSHAAALASNAHMTSLYEKIIGQVSTLDAQQARKINEDFGK